MDSFTHFRVTEEGLNAIGSGNDLIDAALQILLEIPGDFTADVGIGCLMQGMYFNLVAAKKVFQSLYQHKFIAESGNQEDDFRKGSDIYLPPGYGKGSKN